jgi:hypothetical protein
MSLFCNNLVKFCGTVPTVLIPVYHEILLRNPLLTLWQHAYKLPFLDFGKAPHVAFSAPDWKKSWHQAPQ